VLIDAYLAVPVKFLPYLYGICFPSLVIYLFANPKSSKNILLAVLFNPIQKLSGLISLCKKFLE
jgi:cellulose synthase/poly-beta-1,6-N-acetylglucosamine synthase-like glycosyltransferase